MKKLTAKDRAKIYFAAIEFFEKQEKYLFENEGDFYNSLPMELKKHNEVMGIWGFCDFVESLSLYCYKFKEFQLFTPNDKNEFQYWFDNQSERIIALLLAYYMALDAKD